MLPGPDRDCRFTCRSIEVFTPLSLSWRIDRDYQKAALHQPDPGVLVRIDSFPRNTVSGHTKDGRERGATCRYIDVGRDIELWLAFKDKVLDAVTIAREP